MTKKLLTSVAAGALFLGAAIAPAAYAQSTTTPQTNQTMEDPAVVPDATTTMKPADGTADTAVKPADSTAATTTDPDVDVAGTKGEYLTTQSPDQVSANSFIGQSVYNSADESIGDINDVIIEKNGGIVAAVIGVGGFLGMGEKWVAVPFTSITVNQSPDNGDVKLTTTETAESLKAAPEFKTMSQQMAEKDAATPLDTSTTSSTTPTTNAPATEPAE
ncbi:PRC-barrel domain-containing protein [Sinorhizobium sp. BG8]|uniref:PRC-barrel domain-containing protein n=1 Tax=Sinorhizobium sp. BG8 TaxID=2613773 RepID=UPI00193E6C01|nr:PRC-barrel domain-containing protein [Sinorhizobium sp. BG8]QRM54487.1 PRC-barrel domain containing protein [Sinorhizobium sp. BG8]